MSICYNDHARFARISADLLAGKEITKQNQDYGLLYIEDQYWFNTTNRQFQTVMKLLDDLRDARFKNYYLS